MKALFDGPVLTVCDDCVVVTIVPILVRGIVLGKGIVSSSE
jgi:hypothetical protein